jgi:hypothetical protein
MNTVDNSRRGGSCFSPFLLLILTGLLGSWCSSASAQVHRYYPGRDSFLRIQTDSAEELARVLNTNPTARRNLAKYFHTSEVEIVEYVKNNLVLKTLEEDMVVTNHGVTKKGYIYPVKTRIKKGNRIWVDKNTGEPVLKWLCTNPVVSKLPLTPRVVKVEKMVPAPTSGRIAQQEEAAPAVAADPAPEAVAMPVEPRAEVVEPVAEVITPVESVPAPVSVVNEIKAPAAVAIPVRPVFHLNNVAVPAALILSQVGGPSNNRPSPTPRPNTIPEPGTLVLCATGIGLLAARRRKK